ncbi:MAG: hypothetical protein MN733_33830, partial [Nitrososphaera sp.]|nr:hypothetical protein [Nitrososphaera sp.]
AATTQRLSACLTQAPELPTFVIRSFQLRAFVAHPNGRINRAAPVLLGTSEVSAGAAPVE